MTKADYYKLWKSNGICPHCAKRPVIIGKAICQYCRDITYPKMAQSRKIRYEERKAIGVCVRCGKNKPVLGELQCNKCKQYLANYLANRTPEQVKRHAEVTRQWGKNNPIKKREASKRHQQKIKNEVLTHYGNKCACCGETEPKFLTIDHINGGGNQHRLTLLGRKIAGHRFYEKIIQLGYPKDLQILCWNCNMAKGHYGSCPHKDSSAGLP